VHHFKSETTFGTSAKSKLLFSLDKTDCSLWLTTARILNSQRAAHTTPFFIGLYHNLFISQRWAYDPFFQHKQVQELVAVFVRLKNPGVVDAAVGYIAMR
jgi:hypothetical protein